MLELTCAVQSIVQGDLAKFAQIVQSDREYFLSSNSYHNALTLLLVFCPESLGGVANLVYDIWTDRPLDTSDPDNSQDSGQGEVPAQAIPEDELEKRTNKLQQYIHQRSQKLHWDPVRNDFAEWIKIRIKQVDQCFGIIDDSLVTPNETPQKALEWFHGIANVVQKYRRFYGPSDTITIDSLEGGVDSQTTDQVNTQQHKCISAMLANTTRETINRDLDEMVFPYLSYIDDWSGLVEWIKHCETLSLLVPVAKRQSHQIIIQRAIIAACYMSEQENQWDVMDRIAVELDHQPEKDDHDSFSNQDFESFDRLAACKLSTQKFGSMVRCAALFTGQPSSSSSKGTSMTLAQVTKLAYFGDSNRQTVLLEKYTSDFSKILTMNKLYQNVLFLRQNQVFSKVPLEKISQMFISLALRSGNFEFIDQNHREIDRDLVLTAFDHFYDQATNCNKTRGSMKSAARCLELTSQDGAEDDTQVIQRQALLNATHELSSYSLTLTPGQPLKPVDLKQYYYDPLHIIHRILELNPGTAYKQCKHLTSIATDLCCGLNTDSDYATAPDSIEVRVRAMCAEAALVDGDFDMAYEYCTPALSTLPNSQVAWTACFQVGKFVSPAWSYESGSIKVLNKQLDILSSTLKICPKESIPTVLSVWKQKDDLVLKLDLDSSQVSSPQSQLADVPTVASAAPLSSSTEAANRERKRDQISNLLVSGLGWAIGANQ